MGTDQAEVGTIVAQSRTRHRLGELNSLPDNQSTLHGPIKNEGHVAVARHSGLSSKAVEALYFFSGETNGDRPPVKQQFFCKS